MWHIGWSSVISRISIEWLKNSWTKLFTSTHYTFELNFCIIYKRNNIIVFSVYLIRNLLNDLVCIFFQIQVLLVNNKLVIIKPVHSEWIIWENAWIIFVLNLQVKNFSKTHSTNKCLSLVFKIPLNNHRLSSCRYQILLMKFKAFKRKCMPLR